MRALKLEGEESVSHSWLQRRRLGERDPGRNEKWLQAVLFSNPDLVPLDEIEPGCGGFVPICRELTIANGSGSVFLDIFGVTSEGRPVLIECKLWRNPQARREVVAQILEYASLLNHWSFGDLEARIKKSTGVDWKNPIYQMVKARFPDASESRVVDRLTESLRLGDFILIIAGDGIRSDLQAMADHLNQSSGAASKMALVEFQLWENDQGELIVIPAIPLKMEVLRYRVLVDAEGEPLNVEQEPVDDETEKFIDPAANQKRAVEKSFWQDFIDNVKFDHSDQTAPRHGGHGWTRMRMPEPAGWITAFRTFDGKGGLFLTLKNEDGHNAFTQIKMARTQLEADLGLALRLDQKRDEPFEGVVAIDYDGNAHDDTKFMTWLLSTSNRMTSTLRPFFNQLG